MVYYSVGGSGLLFVEAALFTKRVRELLDEETYRAFQNALVNDATRGAVIPGCGGLRKARVEERQRGKGKRGGCRVIYLHIPEAKRIDLLAIYSKSDQDDFTEEQKKVLRALAHRARREAMALKRVGKDSVT